MILLKKFVLKLICKGIGAVLTKRGLKIKKSLNFQANVKKL